MASDRKPKAPSNIPIRFFDGDDPSEILDQDPEIEIIDEAADDAEEARTGEGGVGGPEVAELVASRAELKRLEAALAETREALARRQADFENYRKRIERDRGDAQSRMVAEVARKLLPVVDNLARALDSERSIEATESKEFRHFLHGVELISKQLNEVLESLGVQPIEAVGARFDPHVHEAVTTEPTDEHEPDTVVEELTRGYRIGERLLRPAMVKVAARPRESAADEE
jgi:molecular chaperone GrpE